ncbi:MAG: universal stress protein [Propionibacteriaceae bacterium]
MSVAVAVTDSSEGHVALEAAANEAVHLNVPLVAVNLTGADLDTSAVPADLPYEVVVPGSTGLDEVEQVLQVIEEQPAITRLVVGVRKRSPVGKAVLGSIAQRLILEASVPVLSVRTDTPGV